VSRPAKSTLVGLAVVILVVATSGIAAGHGSFTAFLNADGTAEVGSSETILVDVSTTGADEVPEEYRSGPVEVEYDLFVAGERIDEGRVEMGFNETRSFGFSHTFTETGVREVSLNATFPGAGEWRPRSEPFRSVRTVEVVPEGAGPDESSGSGQSLSECTADAGGDLAPPYAIQCYLTHRGIGGLIPGLLASPVVSFVGLVFLGGVGLVVRRAVRSLG
jgi:hypothetical protein